ncbi:hypothetical protein HQ531_05850 [bacterium]|nr:hypothetical protein [bacterium]
MNKEQLVQDVEFEGHCAFALSTGKLGVKGTDHKATLKGKNYVFSNVVAKYLFRLLPGRVKMANDTWNSRT